MDNTNNLILKIQTLINNIVSGRCPRCCEKLEFTSGRISAKLQTIESIADGLENMLSDAGLIQLHTTIKAYYDLDTRLRKQLLDLEDIHPNNPDAHVVEEMDKYTWQLQNLIPITRLVDDNIHIVHMLSFMIDTVHIEL